MTKNDLENLGYVKTSKVCPPEGVKIKYAMVNDRNEVYQDGELIRQKNIYFTPDFKLYVYFTPEYWKV